MKKTISLLCAILSIALVFVSCEQKDPIYSEYEDAVGLQALESEYTGNGGYTYVSHNFLLMFATEECEVIDNEPFGTGDILVLEMFSESADNLLPAVGVYDITDSFEDGCVFPGLEYSETLPVGSYVRHLVDGEATGFKLIAGGSVELRATKKSDEREVFVDAIFEDGSRTKYYYKGKLPMFDVTALGQ